MTHVCHDVAGICVAKTLGKQDFRFMQFFKMHKDAYAKGIAAFGERIGKADSRHA